MEFLEGQGFSCSDTSSSESFDILAIKGNQKIKVEVKGTTSDLCDSILMTKNEVELHRKEKGMTGLLICSRIQLSRAGVNSVASGGVIENLLNWDIDQWIADPVAFQIKRAN